MLSLYHTGVVSWYHVYVGPMPNDVQRQNFPITAVHHHHHHRHPRSDDRSSTGP